MGAGLTRLIGDRPGVLAALRVAEGLFEDTRTPVCARAVWLSTWFETHPAAQPLAVAVENGGLLAGLGVFAVTRRGPLRTVTLAGAGPSDYGRLPVRDGRAAAALAEGIADLLRAVRRPWRLRLAQLPHGDPVAAALAAALPGARLVPGQGCPQLAFGPHRALDRHMSANARRAARQSRSRLARAGVAVRIERARDPDAVRRLLPGVIALRRRRDHAVGRRSDLDDEAGRLFYIRVVCRLADAGAVDLPTLWLDDRLAAYALGLRDGATCRSWDGRISPDWPYLSLGPVLRAEWISALLAEPGVAGIDWMRGELRHKMQVATHVIGAQHLLAESSRLVGGAQRRVAGLRRAARRVTPERVRRRMRLRGI
jgi:CelD/BcsL family acetyltransferase involved in cellulose biosynthesis